MEQIHAPGCLVALRGRPACQLPNGPDKNRPVKQYDRHGMSRMEPDGTSIRIVNRIGEQMIDINDHGSDQNHKSMTPPLPVQGYGQPQRDGNMEQDMNHRW